MAATRMTRKGQVTIPAEIRAKLDLKEGDRFVVNEVDGKVVMETQRDIVRRTAGVFRDYVITPPPTKEELHDAFADAVVEDYLESRQEQ